MLLRKNKKVPASVNSQDNFPAIRKIFQMAEINIQPALIGLENITYCRVKYPARSDWLVGLENITYRDWKIFLRGYLLYFHLLAPFKVVMTVLKVIHS